MDNNKSGLYVLLIYTMLITLFIYCRISKCIDDTTTILNNKTCDSAVTEYIDVNKVLKKVRHNHKKINIGVSIGGHIGAHSSGIVASVF